MSLLHDDHIKNFKLNLIAPNIKFSQDYLFWNFALCEQIDFKKIVKILGTKSTNDGLLTRGTCNARQRFSHVGHVQDVILTSNILSKNK